MHNLREEIRRVIAAWESVGHPAIVERFVYRNGVVVDGSRYKGKRGKSGECFANAAILAEKHGHLYFEGFASRPSLGIPIQHAWVMTDDGRVIDNTWDRPEECTYFGVPFTREQLIDRQLKTGYYGILYDGGTSMVPYEWLCEIDKGLRDEAEPLLPKWKRNEP